MAVFMLVCSTCGDAVWPLDGYRETRYCDGCKAVTFHWKMAAWELRGAA